MLFCLGFMILTMTLSFTKIEWPWIFDISNYRLFNFKISPLVNVLSILLVNVKILRIITYTVLSMSLFFIIKSIINKKNNSIFFIGIFLIFLLNQTILNESYFSTVGFIQNFIPLIFLLIIINYLINDNLYKLPKPLIVLLGLIASTFNIVFALLLLSILLYKIVEDAINKEKNKNIYLLLVGALLGSTFMICYNRNIFNPNISYNLLHAVVPDILNINFIITIILMAFVFGVAIKLFVRKTGYEKINTILSIGAIIVYVFVVLFSHNVYLNYLSLIFYNVASFYILYNGNKSHSFREKIKLYYFIKVLFIAIMSIVNANISTMFLPALIDIMIILELLNNTFPVNFIQMPYMLISIMLIVTNIIININTKNQIIDMNAYLKRDLSCRITPVVLPSKYKEEDVSIYLPCTKEEKMLYLKMLGIDDEFDYEIQFTQ